MTLLQGAKVNTKHMTCYTKQDFFLIIPRECPLHKASAIQ